MESFGNMVTPLLTHYKNKATVLPVALFVREIQKIALAASLLTRVSPPRITPDLMSCFAV